MTKKEAKVEKQFKTGIFTPVSGATVLFTSKVSSNSFKII